MSNPAHRVMEALHAPYGWENRPKAGVEKRRAKRKAQRVARRMNRR